MTNSALRNLKNLFQDRPEVLKMLDLRELDLSNLTDEHLAEEMRKRKMYPEPVNFYATGRTGAGKSSLGNSLFGSSALESHGHIDCTKVVQYFQMASNLRFYDLPGAGSSEEYENINRVALLIKQLEDEKEVIQFQIWDFSKYATEKRFSEEIATVEQWQSSENQKYVGADIILYVVAPHMKFIRDDRKYLRALLKVQKADKVIFALNIHRTEDGTLKPTPQEIEDAYKGIKDIYQEFHPSVNPPIIEIDSLRGTGINLISELMCQILPSNKIGNIQQVLKEELKEFAKKERSRRYRQALIYIAGRLATYRVDTHIGKGILHEAYAAVCDYGIRVFREEDARIQAEKEIYELVDDIATQTKSSREQAVKILVPDVQEKEVTEKDVIVGYEPKYEDVSTTEYIPDFYVDTEKVKHHVTSRLGTSIAHGIAHAVAAPVSIFQGVANLFGAKVNKFANEEVNEYFGPEYYKNETVLKTKTKEIERIEQKYRGMEPIRKDVTKTVPVVVEKEQEVGSEYLQGGYPVVENLLAIGLGIENADVSKDLRKHFEAVIQTGRKQVQAVLSRYKDRINELAESSNPEQAEEEIISILEKYLMI